MSCSSDFIIAELKAACKELKDGSKVYPKGSQAYKDSLRHYVTSSSLPSCAAIQPGSAKGLAKIVTILKKHRFPFAVRGGGHSMTPNLSSTQGIQIAMTQFSDVTYNEKDQTLDIGAGCLWDQVYPVVREYGRNVVGGGAAYQGVGVAGFLLGGGYSGLKTNRFGLGIDNIVGYEIVLPSGEIKNARADDPNTADLFQALRGGGNNFGIVTQFTLKTHKQDLDTVGVLALKIAGSKVEQVKEAILDFVENEHRPEASLIPAFRYPLIHGEPKLEITVICAFDGPQPQPEKDPFQKFRKLAEDSQNQSNQGTPEIEHLTSTTPGEGPEVSSYGHLLRLPHDELHAIVASTYAVQPVRAARAAIKRCRYTLPATLRPREQVRDGIGSTHALDTSSNEVEVHKKSLQPSPPKVDNLGETNAQGRFGCVMISKYTCRLIDEVDKQAKRASEFLRDHGGVMCLIDLWPFQTTIFDKSPPGAAWPHEPGKGMAPCLAFFLWESEEEDAFWLKIMKEVLEEIRKVALEEGVTSEDAPVYLNTTLEDTPVEHIYQGNLQHLREVRAKYDPDDFMSLTGGFRIPLPEK